MARISVNAINPNDKKNPRTQSWSLTVQRRLPWSMTIESSYVGSKSDQLLNAGLSEIDTVPFGAMLGNTGGDPNPYRPYPALQQHQPDRSHAVLELPLAGRTC